MILKDAFNDAPILNTAVIGGTVPDSRLVSVDVTYSEDKHDIAVLTYSGFPGQAITEYRGLPVQITFGNNEANLLYFYGYVAYVEANAYTRMGTVNESLFQEAKVVCFGASYQLKQVRSTVYKNITLPKLVAGIAKRYNFSYSVPANNYVFSSIEQSAKSDWEVLVETANRLGYAVTVSNTHINVYDPFSSYYRNVQPTILRTINSDLGKERKPGNIFEFSGTVGDVTPYGSSNDFLLKTLDNKGKSVEFSTVGKYASGMGERVPSRFVQEVSLNATTQETLKQFARGYKKKNIPMHATSSVMGSSSLFPGSLVILDNYNTEFDGLWVVGEARHQINTDYYTTYLKLYTDSTNKVPPVTAKENAFVRPPKPRLDRGIWVAETEFKYVY